MKLLKITIKIAVSLVLIAIVMRAFDVKGVFAYFAKVDAATLALAFVLALAVAPLHTARWRAVLAAHGSHLGFTAALRMVFIGYFFNQALPSSVGGDAVRVWCAYRGGMKLADAAYTIIVDRVFTLFALLLMSAASLPWLFDIITDPVARWALSTVLVAGMTGFGVFLAFHALPRFVPRWRVVRVLLTVSELGRRVMSHTRCALTVILASVAGFVLFALMVYVLAIAMHLEVTWKDCLLLTPPVILVSTLPISIAGWGVREGAMVVAFGFIQVPPGAAVAVSVLFGLVLAVSSLPGSLMWWMSGYSLKRVANDTARLTHEQSSAG